MKRVAFAVPGDLNTPTGGYGYDRRMIAELRRLGFVTDVVNLGDGFPQPSPSIRAAALDALEGVPPGSPIIIDGLGFGALPELANGFCKTRRVIALVHHPLALETGLSDATAARLEASERAALAAARRVITSSKTTAQIVASRYGVPRDHITVAHPGVDRVPPVQGNATGPVALLAVGALVPRKGHDVLLTALAELADFDWRLVVAGANDRHPATAGLLSEQSATLGLTSRVMFAGAVPAARLAELYAGADLFVLASRFEGYGMAFSEAISYGLPVIGTTAGAIAEAVPAGAGILVPPGDAPALAAALRRLIGDPNERARYAAAARSATKSLPTWEASALVFAGAVEAVL